MQWFDVDKEGLAKIISRKPKHFILFELLQNAWDENSTIVKLNISKPKNSKLVDIEITDDNPTGFDNLKHSFTLFAESAKKNNPNKRGRFNLGEKLVLSLCQEASIKTTTGTVIFNSDGRIIGRQKTLKGSIFKAKVKMTLAEMEEALDAIKQLIPPREIKTYINDVELQEKVPLKVFEAQLQTELSNSEGYLKPTKRYTKVEVYQSENDIGWIYEMGIPVVETGDKFHINVMQKVPLNLERDNVTPAYLKKLRTIVLNHVVNLITEEDSVQNWVSEALSSNEIEKETVKSIIHKRYGEKVVSYDPKDIEANKRAVSKGYYVLHGRSLTKDQWENVRKTGDVLPAGKVTPTPKAFSDDPNAPLANYIDKKNWFESEVKAFEKLGEIANKLIGHKIEFKVMEDSGVSAIGLYGGRIMTFNRAYTGKDFFDEGLSEKVLDLFIHELAHEFSSDHLSSKYYDAITSIGAKLTIMALKEPDLFI